MTTTTAARPTTLDALVRDSARRTPDAVAVRANDVAVRYRELDVAADAVARALVRLGVRAGDRVGLHLEKGSAAIAAMQGALRVGAVYVPVDPMSPASRAQLIVRDCGVKVLVTDVARGRAVLHGDLAGVASIAVDGRVGDHDRALSWDDVLTASTSSSEPAPTHTRGKDDLAYILYTSGSTGVPKGVCISHENALAFVCWAAEVLNARGDDVFSNHAPFHFDLSVLDLYVPFLVGGSVAVIPETLAYVPAGLVDFVAEQRPTVWYSVPSALTLMHQAGLHTIGALPMRAICFAGEPWPIEQLKQFRAAFPAVRLLNLYGPTETNVCTWHEVTSSLHDRAKPVPIGHASCGDRVWAVRDDGGTASVGERGELFVDGPTVMLGYWGKEPQAGRPYATGDIVVVLPDGGFEYVGRRDHMVKIHGHRVELGEVEAALGQHPAVRECAVVVSEGESPQLVAFVAARGDEASRPGLLEWKRHCAERLPRYMIVDKVRYVSDLPRTRNGKVDRLALGALLRAETEKKSP